MDIKKLQPEAEVTYELETTGEPISITFRVGFIALDGIDDYVKESVRTDGGVPRLSSIIRKAVSEAIHDWDLTEDGKPLSCTQENKNKYLPLLFGLRVKPEKEPEVVLDADGKSILPDPAATTLVRMLAEFAGNAENFVKN